MKLLRKMKHTCKDDASVFSHQVNEYTTKGACEFETFLSSYSSTLMTRTPISLFSVADSNSFYRP